MRSVISLEGGRIKIDLREPRRELPTSLCESPKQAAAAFPFDGHPTLGDYLRWAQSLGRTRRRVRRAR